MITLERGFKGKNGVLYDNINDVHLTCKNDLFNIGKFVAESRVNNSSYSYDDNAGCYVYVDKNNSNRAFRIYKDYADYKYTCHDDAKFISELQNRQKNVKLTEFPTGVVSLENYVIGQEIIYYNNYLTLQNSLEFINKDKIIKYYIDILKILKELVNNEIIYKDLHYGNIVVDIVNDVVKLIDFESFFVSFDVKISYKHMINNLKLMMNKINTFLNLNLDISKTDTLDNLEEVYLEYKKK